MATNIDSLPPELICFILNYLDIRSKLSFSATNKYNQSTAHTSLLKLNLAVLPRPVHCNLALDTDVYREQAQYSVGKSTSIPSCDKQKQNPHAARQCEILTQNQIAADILCQVSLKNLQALSLHIFDLRSELLARVIGQNLPFLRELELNFCHSFIHSPGTSRSYWRNSPEGTPCWNSLVGLGQIHQQNLVLRNLRSVKIQRAGLTSAQLRKLVESNTGLRQLYLDNVTGVDLEFMNWLARRCEEGQSEMLTLRLENCSRLCMHKLKESAWICRLLEGPMRQVSFRGCSNMDERVLEDLVLEFLGMKRESEALDTFILPGGRKICRIEEVVNPHQNLWYRAHSWVADGIDVDPGYVIQAAAMVA